MEKSLTPYEQRLRDEVIYLHSLWQRHGQVPSFSHNSKHLPHHFHPSPSRNPLSVSSHTPFKKKAQNASFSYPPDPGSERPVKSFPKSNPIPPAPHVSDSDSSMMASLQLQKKIVQCCKEFFSKRVDSDGQEDTESEDEDEDEDDEFLGEESSVEESGVFKFLFGLFVERQELRDLYEKRQDTGDLYCLVCGGMQVKSWKKFKGCAGLVQHASAILNTKRKLAHRAFAQVICRVIGWDITRIPMIVLKGQPLSRSLESSVQSENFLEKDGGKELCEETHYGMLNVESNKEGASICLTNPSEGGNGTIIWNAEVEEPGVDGPKLRAINLL